MLNVVMLSVVMLSVVMLNVIIMTVVMLSVVVPSQMDQVYYKRNFTFTIKHYNYLKVFD